MQNIRVFRSDNLSRGVSSAKRVDANELAFFTNELISYDPKDFEVIKTELTSFNVFSQKQIGKYETIYQYNMFEGYGKSEYKHAKAGKTKDAPLVGFGGKQYASQVADIVCAIAFCDADILAAQAVQRDVIGSLMRQAQRSNMELMNTTCFKGQSGLGLTGVMSSKNTVAISTADNDIKVDNVEIDLALESDGKKLLKALNKIVAKLMAASTNLISPNVMLVSPKIYSNLMLTIGNEFSGANVLSIFQEMASVKVVKTPELSNGTYGNVKEMAVLFNDKPDYIEHIVAEAFTVRPPQPDGIEYISYCQSRHGGMVIRQPKSVGIITNKT